MAQPINYMGMLPQVDLSRSLLGGLQAGAAIREIQQQQEAAQQAELAKQQYADDLRMAFSNPTPDAFATLSAKYPSQREAFKQSWDMLSSGQKETEFTTGTQAYGAILNGRIDMAAQMLDQQIAAARNAGRPTERLEGMRRTLDEDPQNVAGGLGLFLSAIDPDRFSKMTAELQFGKTRPIEVRSLEAKTTTEEAEAAARPEALAVNVKNVRSQIEDRAARLRLDQDKLTSDIEMKLAEIEQQRAGKPLEAGAAKLINDSVGASVAAESQAKQALDLANRLETEGGGFGAFSTFNQWLTNATGAQNYARDLRNEYARLRSGQVSAMLPPGAASDRDVAMALEGFPPTTADAKTIASFLRGMAKLGQYQAAMEDAKSNWASAVGTLGPAKTDIDVGGIRVPKGTTFTEFQRQSVQRAADNLGKTQQQQTIPSRSYWKYSGGQ